MCGKSVHFRLLLYVRLDHLRIKYAVELSLES